MSGATKIGFRRGLAVALCIASLTCVSFGTDVIERIVARVNGRLILQSDWERELNCAALLAGEPPMQGTGTSPVAPAAQQAALQTALRSALDRLINQQLLAGQGSLAQRTDPKGEVVQKKIAELRAADLAAPSAKGDVGANMYAKPDWNTTLARYRVTEADLERHIATQLDLERLVEAKLQPSATVDEASVQRYYQEELLPRLQKAGAAAAPLEQVAPKIRQVLAERQLNRVLDAWLAGLRTDGDIWIAPEVTWAEVSQTAPGGTR